MAVEAEATKDEALVGGMMNAGAVVRRRTLVERPAPRTARALHSYLLALDEHGFDAAPTPVGLTADGRDLMPPHCWARVSCCLSGGDANDCVDRRSWPSGSLPDLCQQG
ncbi:hypothetical protein SXANM310S_03757 [Streptomyces xanthochromogenes]